MDNSPFAKLAPELREKIWEYAVLMPTAVHFRHDGVGWHAAERFRLYGRFAAMQMPIPPHRFLASITACRQMYREMFGIFFAINQFRVSRDTIILGPTCGAKLRELDLFLGPAASAAIRELQIDGGSYDLSLPADFATPRGGMENLFLPCLKLLRPHQNQYGWKLSLTVSLGFDYQEEPSEIGDNYDPEAISHRPWATQVEMILPVNGTYTETTRVLCQFEEDVKAVKSSEQVALARRVIHRYMNRDYG